MAKKKRRGRVSFIERFSGKRASDPVFLSTAPASLFKIKRKRRR